MLDANSIAMGINLFSSLTHLDTPLWILDLNQKELVWTNQAAQQQFGIGHPQGWALEADRQAQVCLEMQVSELQVCREALLQEGYLTKTWQWERSPGDFVNAVCKCSAMQNSDPTCSWVLVQGTVDSPALDAARADVSYRDRLLNGVASATQHLLSIEDHSAAINRALSTLGETTNAIRAYVLRNYPHPVTGMPLANLRWEWCSGKVESQIENLELTNLSYHEVLQDYYDSLCKGAGATVPSAAMGGALQHLTLPSSQTLLMPILVHEDLWGVLGLERDGQSRSWLRAEQSILSAAAASIGGAMYRHQTDAQLSRFNHKLEELLRQRTFTLKAAVRQLQQEMSQREQAELQMQHNALHDPLTGLPNRDYILNVLNSMAATAKGTQDDARVAVLWVDLDRFKVINGSMGHQAGNQVLIAVAQRLRICVQTQGGLVGRFGGDEFVIVLPRVRDRRLAEAVAQQVHQNLGDPLMINQQQVFVTASIGISLGNVNKRSGDAILRDSNLFMRRAKMMGRSRNATFDPAIHQQMLADLHLENDLRQAVSELEGSCLEDLTEGSYLNQRDSPFKLHYQPIVDLKTGRIRAFEALIRWQHPSLGNISPGQFIPIAEETGVIEPLGLWILSQACHQLRLWQTELRYPQLEVSVNLSCRQFSQHNLLDHVDAVLGETGLDPRRLKIEITESTLADNYSTAMTVLHELHDRSIQLCMDDFGTGYSSLSYLDRFPLDVLKIDRSFVNRLKGKSNKAAIVRAILGMAESLGMNAIAEGVETPEQLRTLNHLGCRYIQGYFYSPAVDARSAQQLLLSHYDPLATESSSPVEFKNDWPREEK